MNRYLAALAGRQPLTDFIDKLSARWQQRIQPNTPSRVEVGESPAAILADLVAMPTTAGNYDAFSECLAYIQKSLEQRGLTVKRYEWNGSQSLVATTQPTKTPTVMLAAHIDVVPAPPELFQLREADGNLYGRGALDMKGGLAGFLAAINQLPGDMQDYDFGVMITSDEETSGFDGTERLVEELGYRPKMVILPDGGYNFNLERFAKGIWHLTVQAKGKSAHASRPWEGENAADTLIGAIQEIQALFPKEMGNNTSTINLGMFHSGKVINQIPSKATASLDMRFRSREDQARLQDEVMTVVNKHGLEVVTELVAGPNLNDPEDPYLKTYASITADVIGRTPEWVSSNASGDARFFSKHRIPCAVTYPTGANHHGPEEYISQQGLEQFTQIVLNYLQTVAQINTTK